MVLSTHNYIDASGILPSYTHISFIIRCPELETKMDTNKGKSFETLTWLHLEIILIYYGNIRGCEISVRISASMAKKSFQRCSNPSFGLRFFFNWELDDTRKKTIKFLRKSFPSMFLPVWKRQERGEEWASSCVYTFPFIFIFEWLTCQWKS